MRTFWRWGKKRIGLINTSTIFDLNRNHTQTYQIILTARYKTANLDDYIEELHGEGQDSPISPRVNLKSRNFYLHLSPNNAASSLKSKHSFPDLMQLSSPSSVCKLISNATVLPSSRLLVKVVWSQQKRNSLVQKVVLTNRLTSCCNGFSRNVVRSGNLSNSPL